MQLSAKHYHVAIAYTASAAFLLTFIPAMAAEPTPTNPPARIDLGSANRLSSSEEFHRIVRNFYSDREGLDLADYDVQAVFQGDAVIGKLVQIFYKDQNARNIYSRPFLVSPGEPIRFDPQQDPREINEFSDFGHIFEVGARVIGLANDNVTVTVELLNRVQLPRIILPPPREVQISPALFIREENEYFFDARYQAFPGLRPQNDAIGGLNLSDYNLEFTFNRTPRRNERINLFYKNSDWKNVYSVDLAGQGRIVFRFNPITDPKLVNDFSDFSHIYAIGVRVFGDATIRSARLIRR